jgi:hypothetical protein
VIVILEISISLHVFESSLSVSASSLIEVRANIIPNLPPTSPPTKVAANLKACILFRSNDPIFKF